MILLVGICFTTTSCTKEKTLKGTTWIATQSYSDYSATYTLSFFESTFTMDVRYSDGEYHAATGTYTYNDPIVTLYITGEGNMSGTVSGDHLLLDGTDFIKRR